MSSSLKRHNPQLEQRLRNLIEAKAAISLCAYLKELSNTDFRTASFLLAEKLLPQMEEGAAFWQFFNALCADNAKAYLGTCLKAAKMRFMANKLRMEAGSLSAFAAIATPIDKRKVLEALLPVLNALEELRIVLDQFCESKAEARIAFLLPAGTDLAYFLLFQQFRLLEDKPEKLKAYCIQLMKKGDKTSFNLASLTQSYFGLANLPGSFSLHVENYQLSHLDAFDTFKRIVNT